MSHLVEKIKKLDRVKQIKVSILLGAVVGDAAARPLHWVYDNDALKTYIKGIEDRPEFLPQSKSPFYSLQTGDNSCYWDIAGVSLLAISRFQNSKFDYYKLCQTIAESFGKNNDLGYDLYARQTYMQKRRENRIEGPVEGKWLSGSIVEFLDNYKSGVGAQPYGGSMIKETDGFCASLPFVCKYLDSDNLDAISQKVITTYSSWPTSVSHGKVACRIIKELINSQGEFKLMDIKSSIMKEFPDVVRSLERVEDCIQKDMDHVSAVLYVFGSPCYNPGSFQGAIHAHLTSSSYSEAIRKTIRAGGCNCSRSLFAGAMGAAKYGIDSIPIPWIEKTHNAEKVVDLAIEMLQ